MGAHHRTSLGVNPDLGSSRQGYEHLVPPARLYDLCTGRVVARVYGHDVPDVGSSFSTNRRIASWWVSLRFQDPKNTTMTLVNQHFVHGTMVTYAYFMSGGAAGCADRLAAIAP